MAAKSPDNIYEENLGSLKLIRAVYSTTNVDDADTWASGIVGIVDHWFSSQSNPGTQTSAGTNVAQSSGTFTFYPASDNTTGTLFVLAKT
jgi:hypothetical protein